MAGLVEISANDLSDPSLATVKDMEVPADIKRITMNMGLILKGIGTKAERFENNSGARLKNAN